MQVITTIIRSGWAFVAATIYQLAFNPLLQALLLLFWHWQAGLTWAGLYLLLCVAAVAFGERRQSTLQPWLTIWTAPHWLFVFGNEQEGFDPDWYEAKHPRWPAWLRALVFSAWRNKMRNLPFVSALAWLHNPKKPISSTELQLGRLMLRIRTSGWMTEVEYFYGNRFGDIGPRLDQPDEWGGVSWAFRPWGRG